MKKRVISLSLLLSILILNLFVVSLASAAPVIPNLPGSGDINPETGLPVEVEKISEIGKGLTDKEKRDEYLSREWGKIILKNKVIAAIDSFFTKISPVFRILFGEPYSFSLRLLLIIIFWSVILFVLFKQMQTFSGLSSSTSFGVAFLVNVIIAQTKVFSRILDFFIWLLFGEKPWWMKILILAAVIVGLIVIYYLIKKFGVVWKKAKKQTEEKTKQLKQEALDTKANAAKKALINAMKHRKAA
tara:strand:- start:683 stop:1414 length:732 start_codon:yes stop_codon:yes gene_type:complete